MSVNALSRRALNDITRAPGGVIPELITPAFLFLAIAGMFRALDDLPAFGEVGYLTFLLPLGIAQAAGLVGSAAGVAFAQDMQTQFFDRLLLTPIRRSALLVSIGISAAVRALLSVAVVLVVGLALGAQISDLASFLFAIALTIWFAAVAAGWGMVVALRTRSPAAAPMMQAPIILLLILGPAFAPRDLLAGWLQPIAAVNPISWVLEAIRAPFVGDMSWSVTWPGLLSLIGLTVVLYSVAARLLRRWGR